VALDRGHARALQSWAPDGEARDKVRLLRSFDPTSGDVDLDVADPYYDGPDAFGAVLRQVEAACEGLLEHVRREQAGSAAR
jgi:protein-tyrosine phosphatase